MSLVLEPTRVRSRDWSPPQNEHPGRVGEHQRSVVAVRIGAAAQPQLGGPVHAELAEHPLVVGVHLLGHPGGGGDQDDPRLVAAAKLDEPLQQPGAAAPVLARRR